MFLSLIISRLYHQILYYTISYLGYWLALVGHCIIQGRVAHTESEIRVGELRIEKGILLRDSYIYHSTMGI